MSAPRPAYFVTSTAEVCPYCGAVQPSPGNGSDVWLFEEIEGASLPFAGKRECVDCDKVFQLHVPDKVRLQR